MPIRTTQNRTRVLSSFSATAVADTLFSDFDLRATPVYNYWVPGEENDVGTELANRRLDDVPRFVRLTWLRAPALPDPRLLSPAGVATRLIQTRGVGSSGEHVAVLGRDGISYAPEHLQPSGFANVVANSLSDVGGAVANVELRQESVVPPMTFAPDVLDFLQGPETSFWDAAVRARPSVFKVRVDSGSRFSHALFLTGSLRGATSPERLGLAAGVEHLSSAATAANLSFGQAGGFETVDLPSPSLPPLQYVGYILEKYERLPGEVDFRLVTVFPIPDLYSDSFVDTAVAYGRDYRYRIRSVLRWTRPSTVEDRTAATHVSSYFTSQWSFPWADATVLDEVPPSPPNEICVRPQSPLSRIVVSGRLPEDSQRDISGVRLYRKVRDSQVGWGLIAEFSPAPFIYQDPDVEVDVPYVYAATCISLHGEESTLSEQMSVSLTSDWRSRGENLPEMVSAPGVPLDAEGPYQTIPAKVTRSEVVIPPSEVTSRSRIRVRLRETTERLLSRPINDEVFVMRVTSLDTGESRDVPILTRRSVVQGRLSRVNVDNMPFRPGKDQLRALEEGQMQAALLRDEALRTSADVDTTDRVSVYDSSRPGERW